MKKQYTPKYFSDSLPEWKRKKDSLLVRFTFRPLSFVTASLATQMGIGANGVSYFSLVIAILGSACFVIPNNVAYIVGACLMLFWMLLDCTDGNIARSVKKEPFGEFADASSSYVFVNFLFFALGIAAYFNDGLFFAKGTWWLIALGGFAGSSDSLARLLYQKFENVKHMEMPNEDSNPTEKGTIAKIHDRIDKELGQNGIFLPALLICSIFRFFDIFVMFYAAYYVGTLLLSTLLLIRKSTRMKNDIGK